MQRLSTRERKTQIIDEAITIIHEAGYSALTIRELARRVGITEAAIYRHFNSKDEIIAGILDRVCQMIDTLPSSMGRIRSAQGKIRKFVLFHFDFLSQNKEITSVIFSEYIFQSNLLLKQKLEMILDNRSEFLRSLIEESRRNGAIVDVDTTDLALIIIGTIRLVVLEWRLSDFSFDLKARGRRTLRTLEKLIFIQV